MYWNFRLVINKLRYFYEIFYWEVKVLEGRGCGKIFEKIVKMLGVLGLMEARLEAM